MQLLTAVLSCDIDDVQNQGGHQLRYSVFAAYFLQTNPVIFNNTDVADLESADSKTNLLVSDENEPTWNEEIGTKSERE